jgi:small subunit ribosomal protein S4
VPRRGPRLKIIRRLGTQLPGLTRKQADRKPHPPGQHGPTAGRRRKSDFRRRLEEKQKVRFHYGVSETQLRRYFVAARGKPVATGEALLSMLERRLDNVAFRLGFAPTIIAARQLASHGHVLVNGRRVDRAGYLVDVGDTISLSQRAREIPTVAESVERGPQVKLPGYLALDPIDKFSGRVIDEPVRSDVPFIVDEPAIVEFYAR